MQSRYPFVLVIDVLVSNGIFLMRKYVDFSPSLVLCTGKSESEAFGLSFCKNGYFVSVSIPFRDTRFYLFYITSAAIFGDSSMFPSLRTMMKLASLSAFITLLYVTSPIPLKRLRLCPSVLGGVL